MVKRYFTKAFTEYKILIAALAVYSIMFWLSANHFLYAIGPDFVGYVGIAEHYVDLDFYKAINSWWCPFLSWLYVPFLAIDIDALWVAKIIQWGTGIYCLIIVKLFLSYFINSSLIDYFVIAFLPFVLYWTLAFATPDFLSSILLLHLLLLIAKSIGVLQTNYGVQIGLISALAFFAKSFNLYLIACFAVATLFFLWLSKTKFNKNALLKATVVFASLLLIWASCLKSSYGHWMLTSRTDAAAFTINENSQTKTVEQPYDAAGIGIDVKSKYSNWEQPFLYPTISYTETFSVAVIGKTISNNSIHYLKKYISVVQLLLIIMGFLILRKRISVMVLILGSFYVIYLIGHLLLSLQPRFFTVLQLILMIACVVVIVQLWKHFNLRYQWMIMPIICLLFCKTPLLQLRQYQPDAKIIALHNLAKDNKNSVKYAYIAGDVRLFEDALYLSFFTNSKCIGALKVTENINALAASPVANNPLFFLQKNNNNYLLTPIVKKY